MIHQITTDQLKGMAGGDGLILQGCGGDPAEWHKGINEMLTEAGILKNGGEFKDIHVFEHEGLTNILYHFEGLPPDTLDMGKLAMWRLQNHENFGGTWLSDYLPNKLSVQELDGADLSDSKGLEAKPAKEYNIGSGPDEFGVAVWNWNDQTYADGSEKHIAHINHEREITYLEDNLPEDVIHDIKLIAEADWKVEYAIEMAGLEYDPKPPQPNLPFGPPPRYDENDIDPDNPPPIVSFGERQSPYRDEGADGPHESDGDDVHIPITVYIKNALDANLNRFSITLPTTRDEIKPFLEATEISDWRDIGITEIDSDVTGLADKLYTIISDNGLTPSTLDELNYLATRIEELQPTGYEIFSASIEAGRNCDSIAEMINLTLGENLNQFDVFPTYDAKDYGDTLVNQFMADEHAIVFNRLKDSEDPADRAFAAHIEKLEKHVDLAAFGRTTMKEEGGIFTEQGYLLGDGEGLQPLYNGAQDIPDEVCVLSQSARDVDRIMKIDDSNIAETIVKFHAVGCRSMEYAAHNVTGFLAEHKQLAESNDVNHLSYHYILLLNRSDICIAPAMEVYKRGSEMNKFALSMTESATKGAGRPDIRVFALRINNAHSVDAEKSGRDLRGDLVELSPKPLNAHITRYAATPDRIDALHDNGTKKSYDLFEWGQMLQQQHGESARLYTLHYSDTALRESAYKFGAFAGSHEMMCHADSFEAHLPRINNPYEALTAEHPYSDMILIANEPAREILARGDADVYQLADDGGVTKLDTIAALRPACFADYRDLAIKHKDAEGLGKWAERKVGDIIRQAERAERSKAKNKTGEEL